jgi:hypothetical protein
MHTWQPTPGAISLRRFQSEERVVSGLYQAECSRQVVSARPREVRYGSWLCENAVWRELLRIILSLVSSRWTSKGFLVFRLREGESKNSTLQKSLGVFTQPGQGQRTDDADSMSAPARRAAVLRRNTAPRHTDPRSFLCSCLRRFSGRVQSFSWVEDINRK